MLWLAIVAADKTAWTSEELERRSFVERIYRAEASNLVRLARIFTDDQAGAEDIVQEAFVRLYRSANRITDPAKSAAYVRSIVLNLARDHNRRGLMSLRHQDAMVDSREPVTPDEQIVRTETDQTVLRALSLISPRQRDCLVLRFYLELTETEISETLSISPNSVKTHCQRGMAALGKLLEPAS